MTENHLRSHFISNTQLFFNFFFTKWLPVRPFWMTVNHFGSHFSPFQINAQLFIFSQNGCQWPFWMTENHFWSPFQINAQLWSLFTKWLPAAILDDRKSLSIIFLAISDQYTTLIFFFKFTKWLPETILDDRKSLSNAFLAISDQYATFFFWFFFSKWPPAAILEVWFGPFWMIENHFRSHVSPFQINTQLYFFWIFFSYFGSPISAKNNGVLPLCVINRYARYEVDRWIYDTVTRCHKLFENLYTKWPPEAILFFRSMPKIIGF